MDDSRVMPTFGELQKTFKRSGEEDMTMDDERTTEEITEEKTEESVIEPDFEALYNSRGEEIERLHREVTDLKRDKDELQRKLNDATRAFGIIADRLGMIDVADITDDEPAYVDTVDIEDIDNYITY